MANLYVGSNETYTTVLDAINNANSGDNIIINEGSKTYTETWFDITIPSNLSIYYYNGNNNTYPILKLNINSNTINSMQDLSFSKVKFDCINTPILVDYNAKDLTFDKCYLYNLETLVNNDCQGTDGKIFRNCIIHTNYLFNANANFDDDKLLFQNCSIKYNNAFVDDDFYVEHDAPEPTFQNCIISKSGDNISKSNFAPSVSESFYDDFLTTFDYCIFTGNPEISGATLNTTNEINKTESEIYNDTSLSEDNHFKINNITYIIDSGLTITEVTSDYNNTSRTNGNDIGAWEYEDTGTGTEEPIITSLSSNRLSNGETVTIYGENFTSDGNCEVFSELVSYSFISTTEISIVIPLYSGDKGEDNTIEFYNDYGYTNILFHLNKPPEIIDINPNEVYLGESLVIHGETFQTPEISLIDVYIDNVVQTRSYSSPTVIEIGSVSNVNKNEYHDVKVETQDGEDIYSSVRIKSLEIYDVSPSEIYKNSNMYINGQDFTPYMTLLISGNELSYEYVSSSLIIVNIPSFLASSSTHLIELSNTYDSDSYSFYISEYETKSNNTIENSLEIFYNMFNTIKGLFNKKFISIYEGYNSSIVLKHLEIDYIIDENSTQPLIDTYINSSGYNSQLNDIVDIFKLNNINQFLYNYVQERNIKNDIKYEDNTLKIKNSIIPIINSQNQIYYFYIEEEKIFNIVLTENERINFSLRSNNGDLILSADTGDNLKLYSLVYSNNKIIDFSNKIFNTDYSYLCCYNTDLHQTSDNEIFKEIDIINNDTTSLNDDIILDAVINTDPKFYNDFLIYLNDNIRYFVDIIKHYNNEIISLNEKELDNIIFPEYNNIIFKPEDNLSYDPENKYSIKYLEENKSYEITDDLYEILYLNDEYKLKWLDDNISVNLYNIISDTNIINYQDYSYLYPNNNISVSMPDDLSSLKYDSDILENISFTINNEEFSNVYNKLSKIRNTDVLGSESYKEFDFILNYDFFDIKKVNVSYFKQNDKIIINLNTYNKLYNTSNFNEQNTPLFNTFIYKDNIYHFNSELITQSQNEIKIDISGTDYISENFQGLKMNDTIILTNYEYTDENDEEFLFPLNSIISTIEYPYNELYDRQIEYYNSKILLDLITPYVQRYISNYNNYLNINSDFYKLLIYHLYKNLQNDYSEINILLINKDGQYLPYGYNSLIPIKITSNFSNSETFSNISISKDYSLISEYNLEYVKCKHTKTFYNIYNEDNIIKIREKTPLDFNVKNINNKNLNIKGYNFSFENNKISFSPFADNDEEYNIKNNLSKNYTHQNSILDLCLSPIESIDNNDEDVYTLTIDNQNLNMFKDEEGYLLLNKMVYYSNTNNTNFSSDNSVNLNYIRDSYELGEKEFFQIYKHTISGSLNKRLENGKSLIDIEFIKDENNEDIYNFINMYDKLKSDEFINYNIISQRVFSVIYNEIYNDKGEIKSDYLKDIDIYDDYNLSNYLNTMNINSDYVTENYFDVKRESYKHKLKIIYESGVPLNDNDIYTYLKTNYNDLNNVTTLNRTDLRFHNFIVLRLKSEYDSDNDEIKYSSTRQNETDNIVVNRIKPLYTTYMSFDDSNEYDGDIEKVHFESNIHDSYILFKNFLELKTNITSYKGNYLLTENEINIENDDVNDGGNESRLNLKKELRVSNNLNDNLNTQLRDFSNGIFLTNTYNQPSLTLNETSYNSKYFLYKIIESGNARTKLKTNIKSYEESKELALYQSENLDYETFSRYENYKNNNNISKRIFVNSKSYKMTNTIQTKSFYNYMVKRNFDIKSMGKSNGSPILITINNDATTFIEDFENNYRLLYNKYLCEDYSINGNNIYINNILNSIPNEINVLYDVTQNGSNNNFAIIENNENNYKLYKNKPLLTKNIDYLFSSIIKLNNGIYYKENEISIYFIEKNGTDIIYYIDVDPTINIDSFFNITNDFAKSLVITDKLEIDIDNSIITIEKDSTGGEYNGLYKLTVDISDTSFESEKMFLVKGIKILKEITISDDEIEIPIRNIKINDDNQLEIENNHKIYKDDKINIIDNSDIENYYITIMEDVYYKYFDTETDSKIGEYGLSTPPEFSTENTLNPTIDTCNIIRSKYIINTLYSVSKKEIPMMLFTPIEYYNTGGMGFFDNNERVEMKSSDLTTLEISKESYEHIETLNVRIDNIILRLNDKIYHYIGSNSESVCNSFNNIESIDNNEINFKETYSINNYNLNDFIYKQSFSDDPYKNRYFIAFPNFYNYNFLNHMDELLKNDLEINLKIYLDTETNIQNILSEENSEIKNNKLITDFDKQISNLNEYDIFVIKNNNENFNEKYNEKLSSKDTFNMYNFIKYILNINTLDYKPIEKNYISNLNTLFHNVQNDYGTYFFELLNRKYLIKNTKETTKIIIYLEEFDKYEVISIKNGQKYIHYYTDENEIDLTNAKAIKLYK